MNGTFSLYDCRLNGDTPTPPVVSRGIAMVMRVKTPVEIQYYLNVVSFNCEIHGHESLSN